jgi:hypothetical protein
MFKHSESLPDSEDVPWFNLPEEAWIDFAIPPPTQAFLNSFDHLVHDQYAPYAQRERRFSQYKASFTGTEWAFSLLPHRPFIQSADYNSYSGGILREFEPISLDCDMAPYIQHIFNLLKIEPLRDYHLDIHQYRVFATLEAAGTSVPEGPAS